MNTFYILLFLFGALTGITKVSSQISYTIGVQDIMFSYAQTLVNLTSNIRIISVTLNIINDTTKLSSETQRINDLGIDYLIYSYQQNAVLVTNNMYPSFNKVLPFLIIPIIPNVAILSSNAFYLPYEEKIASDATRALLSFFNIYNIVYIDYAQQSTSNNLLAFNNFVMTLVTVSNDTALPNALEVILKSNIQSTYICAIPFSQSNLITTILNEAMFKGQLNPGKLWIFNKVTSNTTNFNIFQQFFHVGADIYSFAINYATNVSITSLSLFQQSLTRDYIRFIMQSINNTAVKSSNASVQLLNTTLTSGELLSNAVINATTHQLIGNTINVMKVNTFQTPLHKFNYYNGQIVESNANNITRPLNYSTITVRIGVILSKAYFMLNPSNNPYGFSVSILNELRKLSNFKFVYVYSNDNLTGEVPTGSNSTKVYNGIISQINQGSVDMSIIPMNPLYIRDVIYPSDGMLQTKISLLTRKPDQILFFTLIFVPFAYNVWFGIGLIILIMTFAFWSINKISPNHSKDSKKSKLESYSLGYSFLIIYSSFVTAKLKIKPTQPSLHIFAFILWFSTLTFVITYASNMIAYMIGPSSGYPFKQASSLYTNSTYKWSFVQNSIDIALSQTESDLARLYNTSIAQWPSTALINDYNSESILSMNKYVLIQNDLKNSYLFNRICNSDKLQASNYIYNLIFPMSKSWPQRFEMNDLISKLITSGTMSTLSNQYFTLGKCARSKDGIIPTPTVLTLLTTISLFLIPLAGIVLGLLVVIFTIFKEKIQRCLKNSKLAKFVYGEMYDANISSIEKDGVWAFINDRDRPYFINNTSLHPDLRKTFTAAELNIKSGDVIRLKYFGKDPVNGYKRFCKVMEE